MKLRLLLGCALWAGLSVLSLPAADPKPPAEDVTELGEQMDRMSGAFRKLRRQAGDAAMNAASLELLAVMRNAARNARGFVPAKAADLPAGDRAKFTADYRAQMDKFLAALDRVEAAFKANDNPAAARLVEELADLQKASHRAYRKPAR